MLGFNEAANADVITVLLTYGSFQRICVDFWFMTSLEVLYASKGSGRDGSAISIGADESMTAEWPQYNTPQRIYHSGILNSAH